MGKGLFFTHGEKSVPVRYDQHRRGNHHEQTQHHPSSFLVTIFTVITCSIGSASDMAFAVIMAFDMNRFTYWFSDQITLNITEFKETSAWIG